MGTVVRVTNQDNGRVVQVKVIDRSAGGRDRTIIDVSRTAVEQLGFVRHGTVKVMMEGIERGREQPAKQGTALRRAPGSFRGVRGTL